MSELYITAIYSFFSFLFSFAGSPAMLSSTDAEYKLSQSGDATCNGLDSADVRDPKHKLKLKSNPYTLDSDSNSEWLFT